MTFKLKKLFSLEVKAAKDAGMQVLLLSRPGNAKLTDDDKNEYKVITSFDENILKRKIEDNKEDEVNKQNKRKS